MNTVSSMIPSVGQTHSASGPDRAPGSVLGAANVLNLLISLNRELKSESTQSRARWIQGSVETSNAAGQQEATSWNSQADKLSAISHQLIGAIVIGCVGLAFAAGNAISSIRSAVSQNRFAEGFNRIDERLEQLEGPGPTITPLRPAATSPEGFRALARSNNPEGFLPRDLPKARADFNAARGEWEREVGSLDRTARNLQTVGQGGSLIGNGINDPIAASRQAQAVQAKAAADALQGLLQAQGQSADTLDASFKAMVDKSRNTERTLVQSLQGWIDAANTV